MKKILKNKAMRYFIIVANFLVFMGIPLKADAKGYKLIMGSSDKTKIGQYTVKKTRKAIFSKKGNGKYKCIVSGRLDSSILYNGKYIYYINSDDRLEWGYLKRIRVDGKENKDILTIQSYDSFEGDLLAIYCNRIYYNRNDHQTYHYNFKTKKVKKTADGISEIKCYKNSIYYMECISEATPDIRFIKMGLDGENKRLLAKGVLSFKIIKNKIYYVKFMGYDKSYNGIEAFCRCNVDGRAKQTLVKKVKGLIYRYDEKNIWYSYQVGYKDYKFKQNIKTGKITRLN